MKQRGGSTKWTGVGEFAGRGRAWRGARAIDAHSSIADGLDYYSSVCGLLLRDELRVALTCTMHACKSFSVHVAFYLWYGTPELDGRWLHWDHATLPHWTAAMNAKHPPGQPFQPPDAPHSPFYPERGLYSSKDTSVLADQMRELADAGVDSVMLSWWGQAGKAVQRDSQGVSTDELVPAVLDAAAAAGVGVSWHIEPYGGRSPTSVLEDLKYLHEKYGSHPAIWRHPRPLVFLYDVSAEHSGDTADKQRTARDGWRAMMAELRQTPANATVLSLFVECAHRLSLAASARPPRFAPAVHAPSRS